MLKKVTMIVIGIVAMFTLASCGTETTANEIEVDETVELEEQVTVEETVEEEYYYEINGIDYTSEEIVDLFPTEVVLFMISTGYCDEHHTCTTWKVHNLGVTEKDGHFYAEMIMFSECEHGCEYNDYFVKYDQLLFEE